MTVMIQYLGHAINAGGLVCYRAVEITLTDEQAKALDLERDEAYANVAIAQKKEQP